MPHGASRFQSPCSPSTLRRCRRLTRACALRSLGFAVAALRELSPCVQTQETPLYAAAQWGHLETVSELLLSGANSDAANSQGNTALLQAAFHGRRDCVRALLAAGANPDIANNVRPCSATAAALPSWRCMAARPKNGSHRNGNRSCRASGWLDSTPLRVDLRTRRLRPSPHRRGSGRFPH